MVGILVHCWSTKALWPASEWACLRATKTMLPDLGFGPDGATAVLRLPLRWMRQQFEAWYQDLLDLVKPVWRTLARGQACLWGQRYYSSVPSPDDLTGGLDPACTERSLGTPEVVCCGWEGASWRAGRSLFLQEALLPVSPSTWSVRLCGSGLRGPAASHPLGAC